LGFTTAVDNAGKMDAVSSGEHEPKDPYMKYLHEHNLADIHIQDMRGRGRKTHPTPLPEEAYCDNWLTGNGIRMLRDFPLDTPWFLMVNFTGPHGPFDVTKRMREEWNETEFPVPDRSAADTEESIALRQNYAAMLENIDRNIGLLMDEVKRRGELERTIIIYCSDHGEMLGDINFYGKSKPDRASVHIPLVIQGPGIRRGIVSDALIELQDLAVTILDLAGSSMPEAEDSISLKPILEGRANLHRDYQYSALNDWQAICDGQYKLVVREGKPDKLFDVVNDPWERVDLSGKLSDEMKRLRTELRSMNPVGL
jgi:arylsulfatase A-like enzyme